MSTDNNVEGWFEENYPGGELPPRTITLTTVCKRVGRHASNRPEVWYRSSLCIAWLQHVAILTTRILVDTSVNAPVITVKIQF